MMKWILAILLLVSATVSGQSDDTDKYIWYKFQYGSRMPRFWADSVLKAAGLVKFTGISSTVDTGTYKPLGINSSGNVAKLPGWPGSGGGTPGGSNRQIQFNNSGAFAGGPTYSTDNTIITDSTRQKSMKADSSFLSRLAPYLKPDSAYIGINSHTVGQGATVQDSGYAYRECAALAVVPVSVAISGTGAVSGANRFLINKNPGNTTAAIFMNGFNDPRRNGLPRKTLNKIINSHKAIFANQYLKSYTPAGGSGATRSGSWTTGWSAQAEGGKTTNGCYTSTTNDSISYVFTDSTVIVALMPGDGSGSSYTGTDVDVRIDGGAIHSTINTNNQTDGVSDGSGLDNKRCATAFFFTGLTNAPHTITLIKKSTGGGGFLIVDYFGHLVDRSQAQLMLWHHIPKMTSAGYATSPANATNATTDTVNAKIDSLKNTYPISIYPTLVVATNTVYDPNTDADPDGIHMANVGHREIADYAINTTLEAAVPTPETIGAIYYTNEFRGVTDAGKKAFLMREDGDTRYIRNQNLADQPATNFRIDGTGKAARLETGGTIASGDISMADRQTSGVAMGLVTAANGPVLSLRRGSAGTDAKTYDWFAGSSTLEYRLLSDDLLTFTDYLKISRNGTSIDSIEMPQLNINGTLKVKSHVITSDADSAVTWNRLTGRYEYAKINGGGSLTWEQALTNGANFSTAHTSALAGNAWTITGTQSSAAAVNINNTGNGEALGVTTTGSGSALSTNNSSTGPGATFSSNSGFGVNVTSTSGTLFRGIVNPSSTNTEVVTFRPIRQTNGTAAAGMGQIWSADLEDDAGNNISAVQHKVIWTSAAGGSTSADYQLWSYNAGTLAKKFTIKPSGQINALGYGSGTHTGTAAYSLQVDASDNVISGPLVASGTYTPTLTSEVNLTSSSISDCQYMRIGNVVTVSGKLTLDYAASGNVSVNISLPVASSVGNDYEIAGAANTNNGPGGVIRGDATNDRAQFFITAAGSGGDTFFFTFTYQIL